MSANSMEYVSTISKLNGAGLCGLRFQKSFFFNQIINKWRTNEWFVIAIWSCPKAEQPGRPKGAHRVGKILIAFLLPMVSQYLIFAPNTCTFPLTKAKPNGKYLFLYFIFIFTFFLLWIAPKVSYNTHVNIHYTFIKIMQINTKH
jgi:hypothetical protein